MTKIKGKERLSKKSTMILVQEIVDRMNAEKSLCEAMEGDYAHAYENIKAREKRGSMDKSGLWPVKSL